MHSASYTENEYCTSLDTTGRTASSSLISSVFLIALLMPQIIGKRKDIGYSYLRISRGLEPFAGPIMPLSSIISMMRAALL